MPPATRDALDEYFIGDENAYGDENTYYSWQEN